jgi:hypothetical protein
MMLHKLRRAMVNVSREPLHGEIEVDETWVQVYLDEFVFRHNRRKQPAAAFQTLLGLGTGRKSTEYQRIRGASDLLTKPDRN